jgi:hypothetical protein
VGAAVRSEVSGEAFLPADEIVSSFHPVLTEFVLEQSLRKEVRSQLLVTGSYDPLPGTAGELIRKDSVCFA